MYAFILEFISNFDDELLKFVYAQIAWIFCFPKVIKIIMIFFLRKKLKICVTHKIVSHECFRYLV